MSKSIKLLTALLSIAAIVAAWGMFTTVSARLESEQAQLLARARSYMYRGFFDRAIPVFNEAMNLSPGTDPDILHQIAQAQRGLERYRQYRSALQALIDERLLPSGMALSDLYLEAFYFDLDNRRLRYAIHTARSGWETTGSSYLLEYFEYHRYSFIQRRAAYQEAGVLFGGTAPVKQDYQWGFVDARGMPLIFPQFDMVTRFIGNYAVVQDEYELYIINRRGVMQASVPGRTFMADSIGSFDGTNFSIIIRGGNPGYTLASRRGIDIIIPEESAFAFIGIPSNDIRALQRTDGMWRLLDASDRTPGVGSDFIYESIALDETDRAAVNGRIFVKQNGQYHMINLAGERIGQPFDEARPFFEAGGLAAVRSGDRWGLVNAGGDMVVGFKYEDIRSSSFNLAAVQIDGLWGYITVEDYPEHLRERFFGRVVIEPQFDNAKQFVNGVAPVKNQHGWLYIALVEFD